MRPIYDMGSVTPEVQRIRDDISVHGYAVTTDRALGLSEGFRKHLASTYFNDKHLRNDAGDIPADRMRARDVIYYEWHDSQLELDEYCTILIKNRGGIPGEREHARIELLEDRHASEWIKTCLTLIPLNQRKSSGTFGVNLFRTFTNVVTQPHQDDEEFIIVYVVDKVGNGAMSYLYRADAPEKRVFSGTLRPGELLIFKDDLFLHGATSLSDSDPSGVGTQRDALVCTVDYFDSYLGAEPRPAGGPPPAEARRFM